MEQAEIFEVGPRDGLQNEARLIPTHEKIALIDLLSSAGFRRIEVASFVPSKWVPQMADSGDVLAGITRVAGVSYAGLTPNLKGYQAARAAKVDEIAIFASASEGFSKANLNASIADSLTRFEAVAQAARADGVAMRGYVSCVTDCPAVLNELPADRLAGHFHDTGGRALENIDVSLARGLRVFDAAVGGLGGCPYAPGASGNVATEAVAAHLEERGFDTGLDRDVIARAADMAREMQHV